MKRSIQLPISVLIFALAPLVMPACGDSDNAFYLLAEQEKSDKDKGETAFLQGDYAKAASELEKYVADHPEDVSARVMLASASLKVAGIDELQLAQRLAAGLDGGASFATAASIMPEPSASNIASLARAKSALEGIPAEVRTEEQNYQLAVASFSLGVTVAKKYTDPSGAADEAKVETVTDEDASLVISALSGTSEALAAVPSLGAEGSAATKLESISDDMAAQSGETDREKLQSFLRTR